MFYAGIGSRKTPNQILQDMTYLGSFLQDFGYCLRSGNADGADHAFAKGVKLKAQIWLPNSDFNLDYQKELPNHNYLIIDPNDVEAYDSVSKFHKDPKRLTMNGVNLMARNYRQIIGNGENNSEFVICWTVGGKPVGGTGQAIRIAEHYKIPIYNLSYLKKEEIIKTIKWSKLFN